ncbi:MAG: hypothetical protein QM581_08995 [Pseudomonas sp.]
MNDHPEDHPHGLQYDLETLLRRQQERRRVLGWLTASGTMALVGAANAARITKPASLPGSSTSSSSTTSTTSTTSSTCIVDPTETSGPYPADGSNTVNSKVVNVLSDSGIVRSDITSSFGDYTGTAEGLPLEIVITLVNVNDSCAPLEGYAIYLWHCTRDGIYSLYSTGIQDQNYLRGVQETDSNGQITFTSIFPACYSGRWPHIHFEVYPSLDTATVYSNAVLTSQMAMDSDIADAVYANVSGYSASVTNKAAITLTTDAVFGDNTTAQIAWMTPTFSGNTTDGYTATITVGVSV